MSSNQTLILEAMELRMVALDLGRTKLDYTYDLEKNSKRGEANSYGLGVGSGGESLGTNKSLTLDQEFFVVLTQIYTPRSDDAAEKLALTSLYDDLEVITRDFANTKIGAPEIVLVVAQTDIEAPEKITDTTLALRANFNIKHRATISGTATLPDPPAVGETWSVLKAYDFTDANNTFMTAPIRGVAGATTFSIACTINLDMTQNLSTRNLFYFYGKELDASGAKFSGVWVNSAFIFGVGSASTTFRPTRADKNYHLVFVYDGNESGTDRAKLYVDGVHLLDDSSGTIPAVIPSTIMDNNFHVGTREGDLVGSNMWDDKIIEVSTFSDALTQAQVTNLYNSGSYSDPTAIGTCTHSYWMGDNTLDTSELIIDNVGSANMGCSNFETIDIVTL